MPDTCADLLAAALAFRDEREWKPFHRPKDLALGLLIEAGELGELFLWKTEEEIARALRDPAVRARVGEEIADVQLFLLYLADATATDLPAAVRAKLVTNARKYPVDKARGRADKYTELG
jgi:NTP pyrophosphatase (non-canonical NTP hydrolase)